MVTVDANTTQPIPASAATPPLHSVGLILLAAAVFLYSLPSCRMIDKVATTETFTTAILDPDGDYVRQLAMIRLIIAIFIFGVTLKRFLATGPTVLPSYLPQSKLKASPFNLDGVRFLVPFTVWCWNLLGISFLLSGTVPLLVATGHPDWISPWHVRLAMLMFEIAAPCAFLVSFAVKYALWPHAYKVGQERGFDGSANFRTIYALALHNFNIIFVVAEVSLLGGLPVEMNHVAVAPLYGMCYVVFAWWMAPRWTPGKGPQFLYFFLDTTLGWMTSIALLVLLVVLLVFYAIFSVVDDVLEHLKGGPIVHMFSAVLASLLVCRFRD